MRARVKTELGRFMANQGRYSTAILKCSDNVFTIVGSVPVELTHEYTSGFTTGRQANCYPSEQAVIDALLAIGYTRFQLADCSWYQAE